MSAEPTEEQWQTAMTACGHEGWDVERTTPDQYRRVDNVARALAAAVTAEREKVLAIVEQEAALPAFDSYGRGYTDAAAMISSRIREVAR